MLMVEMKTRQLTRISIKERQIFSRLTKHLKTSKVNFLRKMTSSRNINAIVTRVSLKLLKKKIESEDKIIFLNAFLVNY